MLLVFAWSKASALVAMCIGSIGNLAFPAISSIKSLNVLESEQVNSCPSCYWSCACCRVIHKLMHVAKTCPVIMPQMAIS